jgi:hypothetical protein
MDPIGRRVPGLECAPALRRVFVGVSLTRDPDRRIALNDAVAGGSLSSQERAIVENVGRRRAGAYLGAPLGRSGNESASIAGTIYRNVWLGAQPHPSSLGSALLP